MITIAHASDLHFGEYHDPEIAEIFLSMVVAEAPDLVVLSGDFTQRAKVSEYREARAFLDRMPPVPVVVTPGNHDVPLYRIWERIFDPYRNYKRFISEDLDTVTRIPGAVVVALNSSAPRRAIVNGRIDASQIRFARTAFEDAGADDLKVLVAHHHLAPAPDYRGDRPVPGAQTVLDALEAMSVDLVLGGHLHRAYIGNSLDVYPGAERDRGVTIVQSGTTTSRRGRAREEEKNSFNLIRVEEGIIRVTHLMYFSDHDGFARISDHIFPRSPHRWFQDTNP